MYQHAETHRASTVSMGVVFMVESGPNLEAIWACKVKL